MVPVNAGSIIWRRPLWQAWSRPAAVAAWGRSSHTTCSRSKNFAVVANYYHTTTTNCSGHKLFCLPLPPASSFPTRPWSSLEKRPLGFTLLFCYCSQSVTMMSFAGGTPASIRQAATADAAISYIVADHLCCLWVSFCWCDAKLSNHYFFFCPFCCYFQLSKRKKVGDHPGDPATELCFIRGDNFDKRGIIAAAAKTCPSDFSSPEEGSLWIKSEARKETRSPLFKPNFQLLGYGSTTTDYVRTEEERTITSSISSSVVAAFGQALTTVSARKASAGNT